MSPWWHCVECGHSWRAQLQKRSDGQACPVCAQARRDQKLSAPLQLPVRGFRVRPCTPAICVLGLHAHLALCERLSIMPSCQPGCAGLCRPTCLRPHAQALPHGATSCAPSRGVVSNKLKPPRDGISTFMLPLLARQVHAAAGQPTLAEARPDLLASWHPTLNGDLQPSDVRLGSSRRVWWVCNKAVCGHEHVWQTRVSQACPAAVHNWLHTCRGYRHHVLL